MYILFRVICGLFKKEVHQITCLTIKQRIDEKVNDFLASLITQRAFYNVPSQLYLFRSVFFCSSIFFVCVILLTEILMTEGIQMKPFFIRFHPML